MSRLIPRLSLFVVPATLLALAACTPFESLWRKLPGPAKKPAAAAVAPQPELPLAIATHRFVVAPDQDVVGRLQVTIARHEDTLTDIARRFNIGYEEIVRANPGVDPWLPGEGTPIVLPTEFVLPDAPREGLVLNLAAMRIYYYPKRQKDAPLEVITHPIGIGRVGWVTPEGSTKVVARVKDPVWTPPLSVRQEHAEDGDILPAKVPAGPDNPLGRHMMRLGWPSYLIHGTNKPPGVGMRSSHGCIRLYPEDIEALYDSVPIGTRVTVVNQPYLLGWRGEQLLIQAYQPHEDDTRDWSDVPKALRRNAAKPRSTLWKRVAAQSGSMDWEAIGQAAARPRGIALPVGPGPVPSLDAVLAQAPRVRNALPKGASWDGVEDQYAGEPEFKNAVVTGATETAAASR
ncbi:MAG: L,D-transpeptidase family protein [Gammaproteobacteria bacterium]|nr:L,D-transpeptidase family protein [Gammaproteobacteria bacterium]